MDRFSIAAQLALGARGAVRALERLRRRSCRKRRRTRTHATDAVDGVGGSAAGDARATEVIELLSSDSDEDAPPPRGIEPGGPASRRRVDAVTARWLNFDADPLLPTGARVGAASPPSPASHARPVPLAPVFARDLREAADAVARATASSVAGQREALFDAGSRLHHLAAELGSGTDVLRAALLDLSARCLAAFSVRALSAISRSLRRQWRPTAGPFPDRALDALRTRQCLAALSAGERRMVRPDPTSTPLRASCAANPPHSPHPRPRRSQVGRTLTCHGPAREVVAAHGPLTVRRQDARRLLPGRWLTDEVCAGCVEWGWMGVVVEAGGAGLDGGAGVEAEAG